MFQTRPTSEGPYVYKMMDNFELEPLRDSSRLFQKKYNFHEVPEVDKWRLPLLKQMLDNRYEMKVCGEDTETIDGLIDSLCSS